MESSAEYFVDHEGDLTGPFQLVELEEQLRSGWLKAEDLAAAEGDTQWRPLSEVVQSNEIPEIPVEDKQNVSGSSNHLKDSSGLGVAAICLLL